MKVKVLNLKVESQSNPIGIDCEKPRFSWVISSDRRGVAQTAYQIVIALSSEQLMEQKDYVWDSGCVLSDQSIYVEYEGLKLQSRQRYYWKVRVWDEGGNVSQWSEVAYWEMGLLSSEDWVAQWIEPDQLAVHREIDLNLMEAINSQEITDTSRLHPCQLLRKTFVISKQVKRATMYATAHGVYTLELNGRKVGNQELTPEFTTYEKYLQYQTYDVTKQLIEGTNVIGAILGDGWYAGRIGLIGSSCQYGDKLALLLQLEIVFEDGSQFTVTSDREFVSTTAHLLYSDLFIGEKIDARLYPHGWSSSNFNDSAWKRVSVVTHSYDQLVAQYGEAVRIVKELPVQAIIQTPKGETVIDFGQVIAGRVRMRVSGDAGTEVILEHSEVLDQDGNFFNNNKGRFKDQKDVYILSGEGEEVFEPVFTFHGFRYVKITGYPNNKLNPDDFTALVLSTDMNLTGYFECSDERLNQLQRNIVWSQIGNMISIPMDCPQRERAGWTGDIQVFAPTACFNMNMDAFLTRWMRNVMLDQTSNGEVPNIIPYHDSNRKADLQLGGRISSAGWGDAVLIVPWSLYQAYGNIDILQECYQSMVKWVSFMEKCASEEFPTDRAELDDGQLERQKYLWNTGFHFGDWLLPSVSTGLNGSEPNPILSALATKEVVATCFYAYSTELLSQIAAKIGKLADAERYQELSKKIKMAFQEEYLLPDGQFSADYQGIYVLALQFQMVSEEWRTAVFNRLIQLIENNQYRLDTGFVSVPFLLDVLCENKRIDIAYKLLYQTEAPSWLYEVEHGATTIWEAWDAIRPDGYVSKMSYNHYAFGCVGDWMYRRIAGIRKLSPGYKHIEIKPGLESGLQYAKASYQSLYGEIISEWKLTPAGYEHDVTIPANTKARIILPIEDNGIVLESNVLLEQALGIISFAAQEQYIHIEAGSGTYHFQMIKKSQ